MQAGIDFTFVRSRPDEGMVVANLLSRSSSCVMRLDACSLAIVPSGLDDSNHRSECLLVITHDLAVQGNMLAGAQPFQQAIQPALLPVKTLLFAGPKTQYSDPRK